jgi:uncharacterized membrane protein
MKRALDTSEVIKRLLLFGILLSWCAVLLLFRFVRSDSFAFGFLVWNLFLAAIPAIAAWLFARAAERRSTLLVQVSWFAIWLAFLPNAPYIVTDFMHLDARPPIPLWYDIALLASCAGTGLLLGYSSLADVQAIVTRRFSAFLGWALALVALFLSGFGIYLGRFLRWNSWNALTNPSQLFFDIADRALNPLSHPQTIGVTVIYGIALLLGYVALRVLQPSIPTAGGRMPSNPSLQTDRPEAAGR